MPALLRSKADSLAAPRFPDGPRGSCFTAFQADIPRNEQNSAHPVDVSLVRARPLRSFGAPSGRARPYNVVVTAKIDQIVRTVRSLQRHHAAKQYIMRVHIGDVDDVAIESDRAVG
jgi:hypothetical protein